MGSKSSVEICADFVKNLATENHKQKYIHGLNLSSTYTQPIEKIYDDLVEQTVKDGIKRNGDDCNIEKFVTELNRQVSKYLTSKSKIITPPSPPPPQLRRTSPPPLRRTSPPPLRRTSPQLRRTSPPPQLRRTSPQLQRLPFQHLSSSNQTPIQTSIKLSISDYKNMFCLNEDKIKISNAEAIQTADILFELIISKNTKNSNTKNNNSYELVNTLISEVKNPIIIWFLIICKIMNMDDFTKFEKIIENIKNYNSLNSLTQSLEKNIYKNIYDTTLALGNINDSIFKNIRPFPEHIIDTKLIPNIKAIIETIIEYSDNSHVKTQLQQFLQQQFA